MLDTLIGREQLAELVESVWRSLLGWTVTATGADACVGVHASACCVAEKSSLKAELQVGVHASACGIDDCLTACVNFTGAFEGSVVLRMPEQFARQAASRLLCSEESTVTELDLRDAVAELCNILGGSLKSLLPRPSSMSLPIVTHRAPGAVPWPMQPVAVFQFDSEGNSLDLQVLAQQEQFETNPI